MSNPNLNDMNFDENQSSTLKDYLILFTANIKPVSAILAASLIIAIIYSISAPDIFTTSTALKITKPGGSILQSPLMPEISDYGNDRFIANEIEILKSNNIRERIAKLLLDTLVQNEDLSSFSLLLTGDFGEDEKPASVPQIASKLSNAVQIEQKRGLDIIDISAESQSPTEAALIANFYAIEYLKYNLEINRNQLIFIRKFLNDQRTEKKEQLNDAEEILRAYQEKGGIIALDQQAQTLIQQLAQFEAQKNAAQIELEASNEILKQYRNELSQQDPKLADYLASETSKTYIKELQDQIAEFQIRRDLAILKADPETDYKAKLKEFDNKLNELNTKLDEKIKVLKAGIFASSPEAVRDLSQKIIEQEIKIGSLKTTLDELNIVVRRYDERFNKLPKTSIELARLQRNRESLEKLYTLVEEKYQEAMINEQSQPGNVLIIDDARVPYSPAKPNRILIIIVGLLIGMGLAFAYVFLKNYFDNTVKTPEDIQKKNVNVLAWIPRVDELTLKESSKFDFIILNKPDSVTSESFRALRTRIQFSRPDKETLKTIVITSPAPQEGKTFVTINLAGSFAQAEKKVLLVDCDLRKPRVHRVFDKKKEPGLIDHLIGEKTLDEITHKSEMKNLSLITSGTIPPNPAEMLDSKQMDEFLAKVRGMYDYVIIDSPPIIAVTDAEILAKKVDGAVLVVSSEITEYQMLDRAIQLIEHDNTTLIGTVLNNFDTRSAYGTYYKYKYYYYYAAKK
ncbi:MAG: polysaccharide biosynthesis tyrosine autokinase [Ignavibacterium sp.]|jgi:tyrosine-protein kinase Etk/Wzc|nr:polysaccharide biosynthesis tyrosine autokinase [Ignavibacterium sp.]